MAIITLSILNWEHVVCRLWGRWKPPSTLLFGLCLFVYVYVCVHDCTLRVRFFLTAFSSCACASVCVSMRILTTLQKWFKHRFGFM